jgi:hypothetical protein
MGGTGLRLADAVDYIVQEVERRDLRDVVLVGHSFAGIPITGAARRLAGRLARVAFYSAFIPRAGESMADAMGAETAAYLRALVSSSPRETGSVDFGSFSISLMQDEPEETNRKNCSGWCTTSWFPGPAATCSTPPARAARRFATWAYRSLTCSPKNDRALAAPGAELAARVGVTPVIVPAPTKTSTATPASPRCAPPWA